jgi:multidrug efflux system outer membrane protein
MRERLLPALALVAAAALSACAVGPDHRAPTPALDATFLGAGAARTDTAAPDAGIATFWKGFDDPVLTALVERALVANADARIAEARLREARALAYGADAARFPQVDAQAGVTRSLAPESQYPGTTVGQRTGTAYDAGFAATWELDFFGRNRRASESAQALVEASAAGVATVWTSISAETVLNYLELRGLEQRQRVAEESIANQRETLRLTTARLDGGRGTRLDTSRASNQLATTEATLPALQSAIERTAFRLATLTAQSPRAVLAQLAAGRTATLPALPVTDLAALPIGTPEQLLRRRPDLLGAERELAAATADIGVATADLFPRVTLSGLIGLSGLRLGDVGDVGSRRYAFGAGLSWPVLDFGRVRARIAATEARAEQALARYEQSVSIALEEAEGAFSRFTRSAQQGDRLDGAARDADDAARLARLRFDAGSSDLLVVLDAQRQALGARDALVQARVAQATALVGVYRSLGGGWPQGTPPAPVAPSAPVR